MSSLIEDYALIGDCETAGVVRRLEGLDWLCPSGFDSDACLAPQDSAGIGGPMDLEDRKTKPDRPENFGGSVEKDIKKEHPWVERLIRDVLILNAANGRCAQWFPSC
jgi:hypothetical protein